MTKKSWSATFRLASSWVLGDILFECFRSASLAPEWVVEKFSLASAHAEDILEGTAELRTDVAHPANTTPEVFVICAVDYVFSGECSAYMDEHLRDEVATVMLVQGSDQCFPVIPLLVSVATASNELGSFLGRDRITALLEAIQPIRREELRDMFKKSPQEQAILALETGEIQGWLILQAVLGGFAPPEDLVPSIEKAIRNTNFQQAADGNVKLAAAALLVATGMLPFVRSSDAIARLRQGLIEMARSIASCTNPLDAVPVALVLLECGLNFVRTRAPMGDRVAEFGELAAQLALEWPKFGEVVRPLIQKLCEVLPVDQTAEVWRLNLRLRTQ